MAERFRFGLDSAILVAVIGIISGVIGAYATATFKFRGDLRQNVTELRKQAYQEFLQGQSSRRWASDQNEMKKANQQIVDAKFNIFMVASKDVICSMVSYWVDAFPQEFPACKDNQLELKNAAIYQAMRRESFTSLGMKHPEVDPELVIPYVSNPSCILPGTKVEQLCPRSGTK
jgi:hypothetical protein